jgi:hypothetical protein
MAAIVGAGSVNEFSWIRSYTRLTSCQFSVHAIETRGALSMKARALLKQMTNMGR